MAQELINIGTADAKTGDTLFNAFTKVNANTTELYNLNPNTIVLVRQDNVAEVLSAIDSSMEYVIDGIVDLTGTGLSIDVPAAGLTITGFGANVSKLICSDDNFTLFTTPAGGCGDLIHDNLTITITGSASSVYGLESANGFALFSAVNIIWDGCISLGFLDNFFQGLESVTTRIRGTPELEFRGIWLGGYLIATSNAVLLEDGVYTLFCAGLNFSMNSRYHIN
jgi:hypothetical protein